MVKEGVLSKHLLDISSIISLWLSSSWSKQSLDPGFMKERNVADRSIFIICKFYIRLGLWAKSVPTAQSWASWSCVLPLMILKWFLDFWDSGFIMTLYIWYIGSEGKLLLIFSLSPSQVFGQIGFTYSWFLFCNKDLIF